MLSTTTREESLMLKEKLLELNKPSAGKRCIVCTYYEAMDTETKTVFANIMAGTTISNRRIASLLTSEGMRVSENTINRVRKACFADGVIAGCLNGENNV
jgi:hypothetical protein